MVPGFVALVRIHRVCVNQLFESGVLRAQADSVRLQLGNERGVGRDLGLHVQDAQVQLHRIARAVIVQDFESTCRRFMPPSSVSPSTPQT